MSPWPREVPRASQQPGLPPEMPVLGTACDSSPERVSHVLGAGGQVEARTRASAPSPALHQRGWPAGLRVSQAACGRPQARAALPRAGVELRGDRGLQRRGPSWACTTSGHQTPHQPWWMGQRPGWCVVTLARVSTALSTQEMGGETHLSELWAGGHQQGVGTHIDAVSSGLRLAQEILVALPRWLLFRKS